MASHPAGTPWVRRSIRPGEPQTRPTPASALAKLTEKGPDGLSVFELNLALAAPERTAAQHEAIIKALGRRGPR